ncbi:MAG TPA: Uma2 family endonuclease [Aggregatilineales bacterium]|nr:Uma2 family endonuclease [Aggregatilineales bacterium]
MPEYGIIDPADRSLTLYRLTAPGEYGSKRIFAEGDSAAFDTLPSIRFRVGDLFAGAPDTTL